MLLCKKVYKINDQINTKIHKEILLVEWMLNLLIQCSSPGAVVDGRSF